MNKEKQISDGIGMLILNEETLQRNRSRMIQYLDKKDLDGVKALIRMQEDDCYRQLKYLQELRNIIIEC